MRVARVVTTAVPPEGDDLGIVSRGLSCQNSLETYGQRLPTDRRRSGQSALTGRYRLPNHRPPMKSEE